MANLAKQSSAPGTALTYITLGAILSIWSGVWYVMNPPDGRAWNVLCMGLLLTGLALLIIGFSLGWIGRQARRAEQEPEVEVHKHIQPAIVVPPKDASRPEPAPSPGPAPSPTEVVQTTTRNEP